MELVIFHGSLQGDRAFTHGGLRLLPRVEPRGTGGLGASVSQSRQPASQPSLELHRGRWRPEETHGASARGRVVEGNGMDVHDVAHVNS